MRLDPAAELAGHRLLALGTLDSTNAEALRLARDHREPAHALWITARQQTAGRGRRASAWISPPGNLYATLLLRDSPAPARAPELSFVAALAVYDAILGCASGLRKKLALKWPNDVLCAGAKLAGMLIEGQGVDGGLAIAIGIGVNCLHHPADTPYPAIDLAAAGAAVSADALFLALSGAMSRRLEQWDEGNGFAIIRSDWLDHASGIGSELRVRLPGRELLGHFEAIDECGRLLLRLSDGTLETVTAGDVFPLTGDGRAEPPVRAHACPDAAK